MSQGSTELLHAHFDHESAYTLNETRRVLTESVGLGEVQACDVLIPVVRSLQTAEFSLPTFGVSLVLGEAILN